VVAEARPKKYDNAATVVLPVNWLTHVDGFPGGLAIIIITSSIARFFSYTH